MMEVLQSSLCPAVLRRGEASCRQDVGSESAHGDQTRRPETTDVVEHCRHKLACEYLYLREIEPAATLAEEVESLLATFNNFEAGRISVRSGRAIALDPETVLVLRAQAARRLDDQRRKGDR